MNGIIVLIGHMILFNVDFENLLIMSLLKNRLSKFQKSFQYDMKNITSSFPFVDNNIYDVKSDNFIYCQVDMDFETGHSYIKKNNRN